MKLVENIKRMPLWVYLLLFGFMTFYTYEIRIASDMGWYMNSALNIFMGNGYTNMDGSLILNRGPVFPLMIAASYWLLGVSAWSAFWVVRIFCILNPIMIYFIGKKFYGKWVGFSAALLILTSYSMNYWSYRHLDAVWPFFIILSILILSKAFEEENRVYFAGSGFFITFAFLIKESAILIVPIAALLYLLIRGHRTKQNLYGCLIYFTVILLVLSPWVIYVLAKNGNISLAFLGIAGQVARSEMAACNSGSTLNLLDGVGNFFYGLKLYYSGGTHSLANNFAVAPLIILAWVTTFIDGVVRKNKYDITLVSSVILISPLLSFVGKNDMRLGQGILFFLLSYLCLARSIFSLKRLNIPWPRNQRISVMLQSCSKVIIVGVLTCLIIVQTFVGVPGEKSLANINAYQRSALLTRISGKKEIHRVVRGVMNDNWREVVDFLAENIPDNSVIMTNWNPYRQAIFFYSCNKYMLADMPIISLNYKHLKGLPPDLKLDKRYYFVESLKNGQIAKYDDLLMISTQASGLNRRFKVIWFLFEDQLIEEIKKTNTNYVIVGPTFNFLSLYFDKNTSFSKIKDFGDGGIKIYRVNQKINSTGHGIYITRRTSKQMKAVRDKEPHVFEMLKEELFCSFLGIDHELIGKIIEGRYPKGFTEVQLSKVYN